MKEVHVLSEQYKVTVPNIGDFAAVDVIEVHVKVGDVVCEEDSLISLETDKATLDVPSPASGTVASVSVAVGDKVAEGALILTLTQSGVAADKVPSSAAEIITAPAPTSAPSNRLTIKVPEIGDFGAVEVIEVHIKAGQVVAQEEGLITLETEKASMDIPSAYSGTIEKVLVKLGDKVSQGDDIAILLTASSADSDTAQSDVAPVKTSSQIVPPTVQAPSPPPDALSAYRDEPVLADGGLYAGPATRRLARELNVDLRQVPGTGHKNRITKEDLQNFIKGAMSAAASGAARGLGIEPMPEIDFTKFGPIEIEPLNRLRKRSARNLHRNWVTIPHVTQFDEADITDLEAFRQENKDIAAGSGVKLTMLVFLMKGVVAGLQQYPRFNTSLSPDGENLIQKHYFHIGVAVDTPNGLVVPVVRNVDSKSVLQLAKDLNELSGKAREGKLSAADMQGSCFTISSLGGIGGTSFTPIVNAPDVAILGVSRAQKRPVYVKEDLVPKLMLPLSLSYDHRVIDGAEAARFITYLSSLLADVKKLLLT